MARFTIEEILSESELNSPTRKEAALTFKKSDPAKFTSKFATKKSFFKRIKERYRALTPVQKIATISVSTAIAVGVVLTASYGIKKMRKKK